VGDRPPIDRVPGLHDTTTMSTPRFVDLHVVVAHATAQRWPLWYATLHYVYVRTWGHGMHGMGSGQHSSRRGIWQDGLPCRLPLSSHSHTGP
jgi:hypothetical protein